MFVLRKKEKILFSSFVLCRKKNSNSKIKDFYLKNPPHHIYLNNIICELANSITLPLFLFFYKKSFKSKAKSSIEEDFCCDDTQAWHKWILSKWNRWSLIQVANIYDNLNIEIFFKKKITWISIDDDDDIYNYLLLEIGLSPSKHGLTPWELFF